MLKAHPALEKRRKTHRESGGSAEQSSLALSVVIPTFNEQDNIDKLFKRLLPVLDELSLSYEVILVDDGSADQTAHRIANWARQNPSIKLVRFSRNFGKEAALNAGLAYTSGKGVIQLDADLQHPPELLKNFVAEWKEGADIVYGKRMSRANETFLRRIMAKAFYKVFAAISDVKLMEGLGDFMLLDRKVVDALLALPERERFTKGLYAWVGFNSVAVPFEVAERAGGKSGWNFRKLMHFAMDAITGFGSVPLKIWSFIGLGMAVTAMILGGFIVVQRLLYGTDVPGYPSLMAAICFFAGVQLIGLGIVGEYLSRVLTEVKQRPLFLVQETIGFEKEDSDKAPTTSIDRLAV